MTARQPWLKLCCVKAVNSDEINCRSPRTVPSLLCNYHVLGLCTSTIFCASTRSFQTMKWLACLSSFAAIIQAGYSRHEDIGVERVRQCGHVHSRDGLFADRKLCSLPLREDAGQPAEWAPWTHQPFCADTPYCVFTNSLFQGNHGVSIISTPETAASMIPELAWTFGSRTLPSPVDHEMEQGAWEVRDIPGKGKGVVALRSIARGELIMLDHASVIADKEFPSHVKRVRGNKLVSRAVAQLPDPELVLGLSTSSERAAPLVEDILRTNSFTTSIHGRDYMCLFPKVSVSSILNSSTIAVDPTVGETARSGRGGSSSTPARVVTDVVITEDQSRLPTEHIRSF